MNKVIGALIFLILKSYLKCIYFSLSSWHHTKKCFTVYSILFNNVSPGMSLLFHSETNSSLNYTCSNLNTEYLQMGWQFKLYWTPNLIC